MLSKFIKNINLGKIFGRHKRSYENAEIVSEVYKAVIACHRCGQKLRIPVFENKRLRVNCSKCKHEFVFDCQRFRARKKMLLRLMVGLSLIMLITDFVIPIYLLPKINSFESNYKKTYEAKIQNEQIEFSKKKESLQERYAKEIQSINPVQLKLKADEHYSKIWDERRNYESKYAITLREKAQLEMLSLSKDKTRSIEDIISGIAAKAAPRNSTINVHALSNGYGLDIDFDMSEVSSGEGGTRTKHQSVDSLRKDVIRLISKVTNDVYQFCQKLDLEYISIGCRRYVRQYNEYKSYSGEANTVLYKIRIEKKDLYELSNNPFLDTYSTTKYFKVEEDEFSIITISNRE
jgi:hypothetical protein